MSQFTNQDMDELYKAMVEALAAIPTSLEDESAKEGEEKSEPDDQGGEAKKISYNVTMDKDTFAKHTGEQHDLIFQGSFGGQNPSSVVDQIVPSMVEKTNYSCNIMAQRSLYNFKNMNTDAIANEFSTGNPLDDHNDMWVKIMQVHSQIMHDDPVLKPIMNLFDVMGLRTVFVGSAVERTATSMLFHGTDIDIMNIIPLMGELNDIAECPGYVNVKLDSLPFAKDENGYMFSQNLQSACLINHEKIMNPMFGINEDLRFCSNISGPAIGSTFTNAGSKATDFVSGFYVKDKWPEIAKEWKSRERLAGWPSQKLIDEIISNGYCIVPVAHPKSQNPKVEFRYSFSEAEVKLMLSLTKKQRKCFRAVKRICKLVFGDLNLLSSYHAKTAFFWTMEETPNMIWENAEFSKCVRLLIYKMMDYFALKELPNYFIRKANIIDHIPRDHLRTCAQKLKDLHWDGLPQFVMCDGALNVIWESSE